MTDRSRNIAVGLTAVAALAGLAVMVVLFGEVPGALERGYAVTVKLPDANGLTPDSRVRLSGIDVGRVVSVELAKPPEAGVVTRIKVKPQVRIPRDAKVQPVSGLLAGSPTLQFDVTAVPPEQLARHLPTDGSAVIQGESTSMVHELAAQFEDALSGPTAHFEKLAESFEELSAEWVKVGRNLGDLTTARDPDEVDNNGAKANLPSLLARADERLREMQQTIDGINQIVNDPQMRESLKRSVANAETVTARAAEAAVKLDNLVGKADEKIDVLAERYIKVADELTASITEMRKTLELARTGDGTVAKLLNDPAVYNNLNDTVERAGAALEEMRRMFQKWQTEGMPLKL
jgi:phospholipid/cholesterol/gamma-HCH transport system substrate-binding protein